MTDQKIPTWPSIKGKSQALRRGLEELRKAIGQLMQNEGGDPITGASVLSREMKAWDQQVSQFREEVLPALQKMEGRKSAEAESLDRRIFRDLTAAGKQVHGESGSLFIDGVVHLDCDGIGGTVRMNDQVLEDLSPSGVVKSVLAECDRLSKQPLLPEKLLVLLHTAYERELRLLGRDLGSQMDVSSIHLNLSLQLQTPAFLTNPRRENFHEYPRDRFRADLYRLLSMQPPPLIGGQRLRVGSGADTKGSLFMLVPSLGRPAHITRIWFEEAE